MVSTRAMTRERTRDRSNMNWRRVIGRVIEQAATRGIQAAASRAYTYVSGTSKKTFASVGVTGQHDIQHQYRKRRMPRRKRLRWKKFVKKVHAVNEKQTGSTTIVRNATISTIAAANAQNYLACVLYGNKGGNEMNDVGNDDISTIWAADARLGPLANNQNTTAKAIFTAAVLDVTFRNIPVEGFLGVDQEVDIYEVGFYDRTSANNTHQIFGSAQNQTTLLTPATGANVDLTMQIRGVTPFDFPMAIKAGKIKIFKKTKVFLPVGGTTTYQYRDPKTHIIGYNDTWDDSNGYIKPGVTRGIIAVHKPVVASPNQGSLVAGVTRTYRYHVNQDNKTFDAARV